MILWKLVQPIFRFRNLDETFPDLFYLLYGILMSYRTRNKSLSIIQVFSLNKASKSMEWILKENVLEKDCVHYKGILSFINIFQFLLNIIHIRIFDLKKMSVFIFEEDIHCPWFSIALFIALSQSGESHTWVYPENQISLKQH